MRFSLLVFDLDGTLIDSRRDIADAANALLVEHGRPPLTEEHIGEMVGDGAAVLVARAFSATGAEAPPGALERFTKIYQCHLLNHTVPYADMSEVLTVLEKRATLAVLTNKPLSATRQILQGLDLARHFAESLVIGGDGPFPRKPDPSGLGHLIRVAGSGPAATLVVGDSLIDWKTARSALTSVCLARYGYGFRSFPVNELGADDLVIDAPADLVSFL